jgi:8-oxo-dGTP diphosphatase
MRVVAGVIVDRGEVLACRRGPFTELSGKWEFPGGKVETNETDHDALVREIEEELSAQISVGNLIAETSQLRGLGKITMFTYFCELLGPRPIQSSDHDQLLWLPIGELRTLDWAELDIPVVAELLSTPN